MLLLLPYLDGQFLEDKDHIKFICLCQHLAHSKNTTNNSKHLFSNYHVGGIVLSTLYSSAHLLIITTQRENYYYYTHFSSDKVEA